MNKEKCEITQKILSIIANFELSEKEQLNELANLYLKLQQENEQLKKQKEDVVKVLRQLKGTARWERHLYEVNYMLEMLGEIE